MPVLLKKERFCKFIDRPPKEIKKHEIIDAIFLSLTFAEIFLIPCVHSNNPDKISAPKSLPKGDNIRSNNRVIGERTLVFSTIP